MVVITALLLQVALAADTAPPYQNMVGGALVSGHTEFKSGVATHRGGLAAVSGAFSQVLSPARTWRVEGESSVTVVDSVHRVGLRRVFDGHEGVRFALGGGAGWGKSLMFGNPFYGSYATAAVASKADVVRFFADGSLHVASAKYGAQEAGFAVTTGLDLGPKHVSIRPFVTVRSRWTRVSYSNCEQPDPSCFAYDTWSMLSPAAGVQLVAQLGVNKGA